MTTPLALILPKQIPAPELGALLLVGLITSVLGLQAKGRQAARNAVKIATGLLITALAALVAVQVVGPVELVIADLPGMKLGFLLDPLSTLMLSLVCFLGVVVTRYTVNYLEGDPGQARFARWLCATLASVILLVVSGNLLLFAAAWMATSLCLHQLLTFYRDKPRARLAARKKFIISRLGDLCLIGAIVLIGREFGNFEFTAVFSQASAAKASTLPWICGLLAAAALIKSAQFPFHSWLPDTMETPTPVSALMHAGIINAGGFLVVRLSPLMVQSPGALNALALVGAFTALFASVIMMTQTSIKKSLAWSTVAQMGFMMLQCGLGAFALAMMHIVAHSLYKAHAFLSSGSIVSIANAVWKPNGRPAAHPLVVLGSLAAALVVSSGLALAVGMTLQRNPGQWLLMAVFVMATAYLLWTLWSSSLRKKLVMTGLGIIGAVAVASFALHAGFEHLLAACVPDYAPLRSGAEYAVMLLVGLLFLTALVFQSQLPAWAARPALARLYVHASNGFYLGTLFNRLTQKLIA